LRALAWYCFGECKATSGEGVRYGGNILDFVVRKEEIEVCVGKEGAAARKAALLISGWFPESRSEAKQFKVEPGRQRKKEAAREPAHEQSEKPKRPQGTDPAMQGDDGEGQEEPVGEGGDVPHPDPTEETAAAHAVAPVQPDLRGLRNKQLAFTLKSIDVEHPILESLGLQPETLAAFEVGYFTGKGSMAGKVVLPFHNAEGLLVAYAGYSPADRSIRYPKQFDRRLELYNVLRAQIAGIAEEGLVLVTDLLNVLRLHEIGVHRAVALPSERLYEPQIACIRELVGEGGVVDFVPWTLEYMENLRVLSEHFHVRLHRYHEGSEDEFLSQVVHSLGW